MTSATAREVIAQHLVAKLLWEPTSRAFENLGIEVTYCRPTGNPALRIDIDSEHAIGRLTWWSDGSAYAEVLRVSDESTWLCVHAHAPTSIEAVSLLLEIANTIHSAAR